MAIPGGKHLRLLLPVLLVQLIGLAVFPGPAGAADWQLVLTKSGMKMETYVQRQGRFKDGRIDVRVKNICTSDKHCWVNTVYEFCKYWGCEAGEYFGDKHKQPPARYEIKLGTVDCGNGTFMLRQQTWYTASGKLLARDVTKHPVYKKPESEDSADDTTRMMGQIFEIDDVINHICKK